MASPSDPIWWAWDHLLDVLWGAADDLDYLSARLRSTYVQLEQLRTGSLLVPGKHVGDREE